MNNTALKAILILPLIGVLTSCGGANLTDGTVNSPTPTTSVDEISFCSTSTTYDPGVAVSGTAKFRRRGLNLQINSGIVTSGTTGAVIAQSLPIKYAEIKVTDSQGNLVQCGTTNALGELKALDATSPLYLPNSAGTFKIEVFSRSNYSFAQAGKPVVPTISASVKEDIYSNAVYKISGNYVSNGFGMGTNSPINLIAQASESLSSKIEGGAFNIYNDWVTTYEYIRNNTGSLDISCLNSRLDMYWKAGFNPYEYVEPNTDSILSFYLRDDKELYISGGRLGDVSNADTDHWDDAVILHEIGHHIENVCGQADSPGGTHYAQYRIDPRLAWSEGFGNFIGAHIIKNNLSSINPALVSALPNNEWLFYHDTVGYIDGSTPTTNKQLILMRMNKPGTGDSYGQSHDIVNSVSYPGESHFREASIARGLFKGANTCSSNCGGGLSFDKYWSALGRTVAGMGQTNSPFSSSAKFLSKVYAANGNSFSASMTTIINSDEALQMAGSSAYTVSVATSSTGTVSAHAWPAYGVKLTKTSSCNPLVLQSRNTSKTFADFSDQRYSNHFFTIDKNTLSGVTAIRVVPNSSCPVDLDLIVYNQVYKFGEDCSNYGTSGGLPYCSTPGKATADSYVAVQSRSTLSNDQVSLNSLSSSLYYILNVRGYYNGSPSSTPAGSCVYTLEDQNGVNLCPNTSY